VPHLSQKLSTRRQFLNRAGLLGMASALRADHLFASSDPFPTTPAQAEQERHAIKNRAPLAANAFYFLPLGSIRARGWLESQLRVQANGLSGHLDETWADVGASARRCQAEGESAKVHRLDACTPGGERHVWPTFQ
jgi:hypothetical protein